MSKRFPEALAENATFKAGSDQFLWAPEEAQPHGAGSRETEIID